jgi:hypothetical protein
MARFSQGSGSSNNGGAALNYVQVVGTQQTISAAPNAFIDLDITTTGAPVQISVTGEGNNASASSWVRINLFRDNVAIGNEMQVEASAVSENVPFAINFIDDVAAGTYNYSARVTEKSDGNWQFGEAAGPVMNAVELTGFKGDRGLRGLTGDAGADGADALWNFTGEYNGGAAYAVGDVATYDGQLWYRVGANGGNVGDTPSEGFWTLLAAKGEDGTDASGGLVYLGDYVSGNGYLANVAVVKGSDNNLYIATSSGGLGNPIGNSAEWSIFLPKGAPGADGEDGASAYEIAVANGFPGTEQEWLDSLNGDGGFSLEPYGDISGDSEPAGEDRVANLSYTFSQGPIDGIPVAADNNNALFVPINSEAFEELVSYQIDDQLSDLSVTLNDQTVLSIDGFADGVYLVNEQEFPAGIIVLDDYITKTAEEIYPFVLTATRTYPGVTNSITISVSSQVDPNADWVFDSDGNLTTPIGSPRIVNPAVPGDITLSAYSGIELSFADVEGAGLKFPDNTVQTTAYTGGAGADIADFVFTNVDSENSSITVTGDKELTIESGASEDLNVRAGDDLWLTADDNIFVQADDEVNLRSQGSTTIATNYSDLGDAEYEWQFGSQGSLTLPGGGEIINSPDSSGDDSGYSTLQLDPDNTLGTDQSIIIDPTGPNHIHVRAGGTPDDSSADLFLGAELNNVQVSDQSREVTIRTRQEDTTYTALNVNYASGESFVLSMDTEIVEGDSVIVNDISYPIANLVLNSPSTGLQTLTVTGVTFTSNETYTFNRTSTNSNSWEFNSNGYITGPAMGGLLVQGLYNHDGDLYLNSDQNVVLNGGETGGEFLKDDSNPNNQIATLGDIQGASTGDITFVDNTISSDTGDDIVIENKNDDDIVKARITLDQSNEQVLIEAIASDSEWFNDTQWSTAVWAGSVVTITTTPDIINFFDTVPGNITRISINDGGLVTYEGASFGSGNMTLNVGGTPPEGQDPLTVTEIRFYYELVSKINIDHDDSTFDIISNGMSMTIDSSGDLELKARDEDLSLYANDDVRFTTNWDNNGTEHSWRMSEIGRFELPGAGYIENPVNSSGDGGNNDTIKIVPDADLLDDSIFNVDQYLIIDPTRPNHIHIRAGGAQDYSTTDLILGGERAGVKVSDTDGTTVVQSKQEDYNWTYENINGDGGFVYVVGTAMAEPDINDFMIMDGAKYVITSVTRDEPNGVTSYETTPSFDFATNENYTFTRDNGEHAWTFSTAGYLNGPTETGRLRVTGIINDDGDLYVQSDQDVVIGGGESNGEFLNDPTDPNNQIATIGDISNLASGEVSFTVNGGSLGTMPTFDGAPLFSGSYVKTGPMVHFQIQVDMDNITNFGTGQYYVDLPFPAKYGYQVREGCLHDVSTDRQYAIGGHVFAGQSRLNLFFTDTNGQDQEFDHNSPVTLAIADNFHVSGTYIAN